MDGCYAGNNFGLTVLPFDSNMVLIVKYFIFHLFPSSPTIVSVATILAHVLDLCSPDLERAIGETKRIWKQIMWRPHSFQASFEQIFPQGKQPCSYMTAVNLNQSLPLSAIYGPVKDIVSIGKITGVKCVLFNEGERVKIVDEIERMRKVGIRQAGASKAYDDKCFHSYLHFSARKEKYSVEAVYKVRPSYPPIG